MNSLFQLVRYAAVGIVNTLISVIVIVVLTYLKWPPVAANLAGYAAGLINSFIMNRAFTFKSRKGLKTTAPFLVSFGIAYAVNLAALFLCAPLKTVHILIPQAAGLVAYNVTFFILMKFWVFENKEADAGEQSK